MYFINKPYIPGLYGSWLKQAGLQWEVLRWWFPGHPSPRPRLLNLSPLSIDIPRNSLNDPQKHVLKIHVQFSHAAY